jgi:group I intron endonuclease
VITNAVNGKQYVGQTRGNIHRRWLKHVSDRKRLTSYPLYRAFAKYGIESFSVMEQECCDVADLNAREIYWMEALNTRAPNGYNAMPGGTMSDAHVSAIRRGAGHRREYKLSLLKELPVDHADIRRTASKFAVHFFDRDGRRLGKAMFDASEYDNALTAANSICPGRVTDKSTTPATPRALKRRAAMVPPAKVEMAIVKTMKNYVRVYLVPEGTAKISKWHLPRREFLINARRGVADAEAKAAEFAALHTSNVILEGATPRALGTKRARERDGTYQNLQAKRTKLCDVL